MSRLQYTARVRLVEQRWLGEINTYNELTFVEFACAGAGSLASQRAAIRGLAAYGKQIDELANSPGQDIGKLWESVRKEYPEAYEPPNNSIDEEAECLALAAEFGTFDPNLAEPELGPLAALAILPDLIAALKKIAIGALTLADEARRGKAIGQFVANSKATINAAISELEEPDSELAAFCSSGPGRSGAICKPFADGQTPTLLDAALIGRKWASLRPAYFRYEALSEMASIAAKRQLSKSEKSNIMTAAMQIDADLRDWDSIWSVALPSGLVKAMRTAQRRLETLADGKLSKREAYDALVIFGKAVSDITAGANDVKGKISGLGAVGSDASS